jgi:hypothetical protein
MQNKANLRKDKMNANSVITRDYGENARFGLKKNKANSKPIAGLWPEILKQDEWMRNDRE